MKIADKSTFIKLDRNIQDWRWYKDGNTFRVFIHLLLNANIKKNGFEGIDIQRGQLATSYPSIAEKSGLSVQQARTAVKHLKLTGELTVKAYPKFSLVTVLNYDLYQGNQQGNQQATNRHLTGNQQSANNNIRMEECNNSISSSSGPPPTQNDIISFASENNLTNVDCVQFFTYYDAAGWKTNKGEPITDWKSSLIRWNKTEKVKPKESQKSYAAYDLDLFEKNAE